MGSLLAWRGSGTTARGASPSARLTANAEGQPPARERLTLHSALRLAGTPALAWRAGPLTRHRAQHGASLVDALLGVLVVAVGMVSTGRLQSHLRFGADNARQRAEAARLAQQEIEQLRAFVLLGAGGPGSGSANTYASLGSATWTAAEMSGRTARYEISRTMVDDATAPMKSATVTVGWSDRRGAAQQLAVASLISRSAPGTAAALGVVPAGQPVAPLLGRHVGIPVEAGDLGNGRSAFKPVSNGVVAWVVDNRSGRVVERCDGVAASRGSRELTASDLTACTASAGLLLSGRVRFALGSTANADAANDRPLATSLVLEGGGGTAAECLTEAVKIVSRRAGGMLIPAAVDIDAAPVNPAVDEWTDSGDRHLRYHCIVTPSGPADGSRHWSGRTVLVAQGWRVGIDGGERRVCRYTADAASGLARERNATHPETYVEVDQALQEQNFLVIDSLQACPAAGGTATVATIQHQP